MRSTLHTSTRLSEGLARSETFLAQQGLIAGRKVSAPCGTHCPATSTFCATRYVHGNESFLSPQNHSGPRVAKLNKILQGNFSCLYGAIFLYVALAMTKDRRGGMDFGAFNFAHEQPLVRRARKE